MHDRETASPEKLRGGYYTPPDLARWLCRRAIRTRADRVLEPSAGDGRFLTAAAEVLQDLGAAPADVAGQLTAVEIDPGEAVKAAARLRVWLSPLSPVLGGEGSGVRGSVASRDADPLTPDPSPPSTGERGGMSVRLSRITANVLAEDFFAWLGNHSEERFDCVVGNPPFIRYQSFPEPSRSRALELMAKLGLRPNKLTNIWVPFVVGAVTALASDGRLALVLPAELLQVSYAAPLRGFLAERFRRIDLFACNHLLFPDALQEVVLLLAEGCVERPTPGQRCVIDLVEVAGVEALPVVEANGRHRNAKVVHHDREKWLKYFLSAREIDFMRRLRAAPQLTTLKQHASVDVGVVTGENQFFVVSQEEVRAHGLTRYVVPLIGRSQQLRGARLTAADWKALAAGGQRVYLLLLPAKGRGRLPGPVRAYLRAGERRGVHRGYKCSIREPWYVVPSVWTPDCFFFRQIYDFPRIVVNRAEAVSTDTVHRLTSTPAPELLAANLYTRLTAASAEIEGRSYGGGVLELEPTEAENLLVPTDLKKGLSLREIDRLVRAGRLEEALRTNERHVLRDGVGLTERECNLLGQIGDKMRQRRLSRHLTKSTAPGI